MIFTIRVSDRAVVVPDARMETATLTDAGGWTWAAEVVDRKSNEQYADECLAAAKKNADAKLDWFKYTSFSTDAPEQSKSKFAIGELVRLKSGGPVMTVESVEPSGAVSVIWFVNGISHSTIFGQETLQHEPTEAEKQAEQNAARFRKLQVEAEIDQRYQQLKAEKLQAEVNAQFDAIARWSSSSVVRSEQLTTHRENVINYINSSKGGFNYHRLKRILLYIVKHVRFQDDKK